MVSLEEITKGNSWDCVSLEAGEDQKEFVTSNAVSLAQSTSPSACRSAFFRTALW